MMLKVVPVSTSVSRSASLAPTSTVIGWFTLLISVSKILPLDHQLPLDVHWVENSGGENHHNPEPSLHDKLAVNALSCGKNWMRMRMDVWRVMSEEHQSSSAITYNWQFYSHWENWLSNKSRISSSVRVDICLPLSSVMELCSASSRK